MGLFAGSWAGRRNPVRAQAALALLVALAGLTAGAAPASAGVANAGLRGASHSNPLAGMRWGYYTGTIDGVYPAYQAARGRPRALLAKIARRPAAYWFGAWYRDQDIRHVAEQYIAQDTGSDPDVLAQVAVFRIDPWETDVCKRTPGARAQASYRHWVDNFAAGIGDSRVAVILQPDLPFSLCAPSRVPLRLVAYAAARFNALAHATVYIDAGAAWWPLRPAQAARMLVAAGLRNARGFAMNDTQYDATGRELEWGARIESELARLGVHGKRMVINTAESGAPFLYGEYHGNHANPRVCASRTDRICASLGVPPTWRVSDRRWRLSAHDRWLAARYADAYLWVGRPWLVNGAGAFDLRRALGMAAASPF